MPTCNCQIIYLKKTVKVRDTDSLLAPWVICLRCGLLHWYFLLPNHLICG